MAFLVLLTACGTASTVVQTASPPPDSVGSVSPIERLATASESAAPTPSPTPPLHPDGVAQVVTTDLVSRSAPGTSADSKIYPGALDAPTLLFLLDGPVAADGYDWYLVAPFEKFLFDVPEVPPLGWVASGSREGEAWIAPWEGDCPESTLEAIHGRPYLLLLGCFGDQPLTLDSNFNGCFVSDPATVSPSWLAHTGCSLVPFGWEPGGDVSGGFVIRSQGEHGMPYGEWGSAIRVVGHFDDPAAGACTDTAPFGDAVMPPELIVLRCRAQFVVTDVSAIQAP